MISILIACILSGILYRMGGAKGYNTKFRDFGCPLVLTILLTYLFGWHWVYVISFGLSFGALTTYWDSVFKYDNFYAHGLGCGLALIPLCWVIPWWIVISRLVICTIGMGLWSKLVGNDVREEIGRGVLFIL